MESSGLVVENRFAGISLTSLRQGYGRLAMQIDCSSLTTTVYNFVDNIQDGTKYDVLVEVLQLKISVTHSCGSATVELF